MLCRSDPVVAVDQMKDGSLVEVYHTSNITKSVMYPFYLRQLAELIDRKLTIPVTKRKSDEEFSAVYIMANGVVLGHIVYDTVKEKQTSSIVLSAVKNEIRGNGLYSILHKYFEYYAALEGSTKITSWTHKNNISRQRSAAKVGLTSEYVVMAKYVR